MNALLEQIANHASDDLKSLIESGNDDILTAIHKVESEAQLQEQSPKFNLSFKISVDLDKSTFDCDLSWSLKQTLSVSHQIEDPAQTKLPIDEMSMTVKTKGRAPVTITAAQAKKALKRIEKLNANL